MLKKSLLPHLKVQFSLSTIIIYKFRVIKSRKLEQKIPKGIVCQPVEKQGYSKCKLKYITKQK